MTGGGKQDGKISDSVFYGLEYELVADQKKARTCWGRFWTRRSIWWKVTFATLQLLLLGFFVIFVVLPFIYKCSYRLQRAAVFLNFKNIPPNPDYEHPSKYGLDGAQNTYVTTDEGVRLGVWQIISEKSKHEVSDNNTHDIESILANGEDVVLYNHGNGGCRLTAHRVELYKVLRKQFHVIAYDYRSYGDSSDLEPSEDALVRDAIFMMKWVKSKANGHVFIWGHSLGTSLSTQALSKLHNEGFRPTGLFLESPFNNMKEEISEFPLSMLFKNLPWFGYMIIEPMQENNFLFKTDEHICNVDIPIIILHAVDDNVVPFKLGYKLYEAALKCKSDKDGKVSFHKFDAKLNYGHKFMYKDPELLDIIRNFVSESISETKSKNLL